MIALTVPLHDLLKAYLMLEVPEYLGQDGEDEVR